MRAADNLVSLHHATESVGSFWQPFADTGLRLAHPTRLQAPLCYKCMALPPTASVKCDEGFLSAKQYCLDQHRHRRMAHLVLASFDTSCQSSQGKEIMSSMHLAYYVHMEK